VSDYDNTNSGALFANADRKTDKHPNARGTLNVEGREYWISAWTKTSKKGEKYQSLSIQPKEPRDEARAVSRADGAFDDDVPF
jgi:uncharacterized protein (DUF736 family)